MSNDVLKPNTHGIPLTPMFVAPPAVASRYPSLPLDITLERNGSEDIGLDIKGMILTGVVRGLAGDRAGARDVLGLSLTHVNGVFLSSRVAGAFDAKDLVLTFGLRNEDQLVRQEGESLGMQIDEVDVVGGGAGLATQRELLLKRIVQDSPAARSPIRHYTGHNITHINGTVVRTLSDIRRVTHAQNRLIFRFTPSGSPPCPDKHASIFSMTQGRSGHPVSIPPFNPVLSVPKILNENVSFPISVTVTNTERVDWGIKLWGLELTAVTPGSPGERAGLENYIGLSLLSCDNVAANDPDTIAQHFQKTTVYLEFGLRNEVEVTRSSLQQDWGLCTSGEHGKPILTDTVQPSPAEDAVVRAFKGAFISHADNIPVNSYAHLETLVRDNMTTVLRFADPDRTMPPDAASNIMGARMRKKAKKAPLAEPSEADEMRIVVHKSATEELGAQFEDLKLIGVTKGGPAERAGMGRCVGMEVGACQEVPVHVEDQVHRMCAGETDVVLQFVRRKGSEERERKKEKDSALSSLPPSQSYRDAAHAATASFVQDSSAYASSRQNTSLAPQQTDAPHRRYFRYERTGQLRLNF